MDTGAWWATVHGLTESDTTEQLTLLLFHFQCDVSPYTWKLSISITHRQITLNLSRLEICGSGSMDVIP